MRAMIMIFALMFTVVIASAQTATLAPKFAGGTYVDYTTDNTLTNTTAKWFQFNFDPKEYVATNLLVNLDSASGNHTNVAVAVYGRINDLQTWTQIGSTINWKGTTSDTTIVFASSTEAAYRQFKVLYTGTGTGTTTIDRQSFAIWYGIP
jgi:hypothetical protein